METIKTTVMSTLETVKTKIEETDENVKNRPKVFSADGEEEKKEEKPD